MIVQDTDLAYLAGIVDSDGCIRMGKVSRCNGYWFNLTVVNTDGRLMSWLQKTFGGTVNTGREADSNYKKVYYWTARFPEAITILQAIYPYLKVKCEQADTALILQSLKETYNVRRGSVADPAFVDVADALVKSCSLLKKEVYEYVGQAHC